MRLARIIFAGALLFGVGCMLPEEGEHGVDPASLDDSIDEASAALLSEDQAGDYAIEADEELLGGQDYWVCWFCYEDKGHHGGGLEDKKECPKEYCYHAKHKKKDKAKDKAEDECEDEHKHGCYFKECKKVD